MKKFLEFLKDEEGATALEYGILAAAIAAVIVGAVIAVRGTTNITFGRTLNTMNDMP